MPNIVLAIEDYKNHLSWEGYLQQKGLEEAGFHLCGYGYDDGCTSVPRLLDRHKPEIVVVTDPRDWHRSQEGTSSLDAHFDRYNALYNCGAYVAVVFKDAWAVQDWQSKAHCDMGAHALITYASDDLVQGCASEYIGGRRLIQTHHSIDSIDTESVGLRDERYRCIVTGARNANMYPLRERAFIESHNLGIASMQHPGYGNKSCGAIDYLYALARYKCHIATSNKWGFPMAKIIESVAMGATPITDLPESEVLPEIDGALCRVSDLCELESTIDEECLHWNKERRAEWAMACASYYDHEAVGRRLAFNLHKAAEEWRNGGNRKDS